MAREDITFKVNLRQNQNDTAKIYGKWFCEPDSNDAINLKGFARHLAEHGKLASYDMLVLVLNNVVTCMKELLSQGVPVKLDGLGTFRPTIENEKGGSPSVEDALAKGADKLIKGVHMTFFPENSKGEALTSKAFKDECVFEFAYVVSHKEKMIDGKKKSYQEKIPVSSYAVATYEPEEDPDDGNGD